MTRPKTARNDSTAAKWERESLLLRGIRTRMTLPDASPLQRGSLASSQPKMEGSSVYLRPE